MDWMQYMITLKSSKIFVKNIEKIFNYASNNLLRLSCLLGIFTDTDKSNVKMDMVIVPRT